MRVLFVCTGNTCRSPMMKFMFEDHLSKLGVKDMTVDCAGTMKHEKPISDEAASVLQEHGVSYRGTVSKFCDEGTVNSADIIICADAEHAEFLKAEYGCGHKMITFDEICGHNLEDPYGHGIAAYEKTYESIKSALPLIYEYITK